MWLKCEKRNASACPRLVWSMKRRMNTAHNESFMTWPWLVVCPSVSDAGFFVAYRVPPPHSIPSTNAGEKRWRRHDQQTHDMACLGSCCRCCYWAWSCRPRLFRSRAPSASPPESRPPPPRYVRRKASERTPTTLNDSINRHANPHPLSIVLGHPERRALRDLHGGGRQLPLPRRAGGCVSRLSAAASCGAEQPGVGDRP